MMFPGLQQFMEIIGRSLMKITRILTILILFLFLYGMASEHDIINAAKAGDAVRVKSLLETNPELVKMTDDGIKATALHWAVMYGKKDVVRVILTYNPDVNMEEAHAGTTMHWAAHYDDSEVIGWLLDRGAEIDHKNHYERTPLLVAARRGCKDVVEFLIERGADISATIKDGSTALHIAAANGHTNVVESLLAKGADASIKKDRNETYKDVLFTRPETTTINTDLLDDYAGLYERQGGQTMDIRKENHRLYYYAYGKDELLPISDSYFIRHAELGYFRFLRNEESKVTELIYKIGGRQYRAKKIKSYSDLSGSGYYTEHPQGKLAETDEYEALLVKRWEQNCVLIKPEWKPGCLDSEYLRIME